MVDCLWLKARNLAMNVEETRDFQKSNVAIVLTHWHPGCGFTSILSVGPVLCWPPWSSSHPIH